MSNFFMGRDIVNGGMLRNFTKKNISIMLQVVDDNGSTLSAKSTDGQDIRVQLPNNEPLGARPGNWVEIIGTVQSNDTINAKEAILFNEDDINFDKEAYNMLVLFLHNARDIYISRQSY